MSEMHNTYEIKRAVLSATGDFTIAAVTGKKIVVTSLVISSAVDEALTIKNGTTSVGTIHPVGANQSLVLPHNPDGWWITTAAAAFVISPATGSTAIIGSINYTLL